MSTNESRVLGNLGANPEFHVTTNGAKVCRFSVATNHSYKNAVGETMTKTQWHRIIVWGKQAEACNTYLNKGRQVQVLGRFQTRKYTDSNGIERISPEIVANTVQFLGGGPRNEETQTPEAPQEEAPKDLDHRDVQF